MKKKLSVTILLLILICCYKVSAQELSTQFFKAVLRLSEDFALRSFEEKNNVEIHSEDYRKFFNFSNIVSIVNSLRYRGEFLQAYTLYNDSDFKKLNLPVVIYLENEGFVTVEEKKKRGGILYYKCINFKDDNRYFNEKQIFSLWNGIIFSLPVEGIMIENIKNLSLENKGRFFAIFSHHREADFKVVKKIIDNLYQEAKKDNRELIYVDELGLIPEDTIDRTSKMRNITRQDAFKDIKNQLFNDLSRLEKGQLIYDASPLYKELYAYLAKKEIHSVMEDLDYNLWERIVDFDNKQLSKKALGYFMKGEIKNYIEDIKYYNDGFYELNIKLRDDLFASQIEKLMLDKPDAIIFTIRGLAHYGFENRINNDNFRSYSFVVCEGKMYENFNYRTWLHTLWNNDVVISREKEQLYLVRAVLQDALTKEIMIRSISSILEARRLSYYIVNKIKAVDMIKLFMILKIYNDDGFINSQTSLREFNSLIYTWCVENNFLESSIE